MKDQNLRPEDAANVRLGTLIAALVLAAFSIFALLVMAGIYVTTVSERNAVIRALQAQYIDVQAKRETENHRYDVLCDKAPNECAEAEK